ncbi:MAG: cation transporter [Epsilonproteobacteria bacterium]|nr:cation transporter [Campylobacterota bacterium]
MSKIGKELWEVSAQRRATIVSTSVAALLTLIKLTIGILSNSVSLLASAIDSILDMIVSLFNFFAIKKAEEHPDDLFPYGKGKIQAIAGVIEGTIITISGLYIIFEGIKKLIKNEPTNYLGSSIGVMIISIIITFLLVKYLLKVAKETDNIVIKADALHYKTDLLSNGVVLVALLLVAITDFDWIDAILGIAIGAYIIYSAFEIIKEGIYILLDRSLPVEIVSKIGEILSSHPKIRGYHWLKTRTDGTHNFVEFHMVLTPEMTLKEAHDIAEEIECKIASLDPKKGWVITPHFDPDNDEKMNILYYNGEIDCAKEQK